MKKKLISFMAAAAMALSAVPAGACASNFEEDLFSRIRSGETTADADLDGDIDAQLEASSRGTVTLILAHGDNSELVARYAPLFRGKVVLTTQNRPHGNVLCFGGFTDGDRAVCLARHFGIRRIILLGFDFDNPSFKDGSDPAMKARKLRWAEKIIDPSSPDIVWPKH